jgi:lipopolysaccharide transport system permease protein
LRSYLPFAFIAEGLRHRRLIGRLAWRRIEARYRGSVLGLAWTLLHPMMMLAIYTFVFSFVFKSRWGSAEGPQTEFALFLFSGMILYAIFAECINEAPGLMLANQIYIKQLVFPTEVLAWVTLLTSLFVFAINSLLLMVFYFAIRGCPPESALWLPVIVAPVLLLTLGMVWFLSSLGVYIRDIGQVVGVFTTALLFMSPVFYPASAIPENLRGWYFLNPFASILDMSKAALFYGVEPDWVRLGELTLAGWVVAWLGFAWFMKTKRGFADVL